MHSVTRILNFRQNVIYQPTLLLVRHTSAGPPTVPPAKEGSLTYKYEQFIGKWPKVLALHRTVVEGSRWCFSDVKIYLKTRRALSSGQRKITDLTVDELETLVQIPVEGPKMAVITALLPMPLTIYIFAFAVIFFPRLVLTRHFWSDKQRREFFQLEVTKALISGEELLKTYGNSSKSDEQKLKPLDKVDSSESLLLHGLHSMYLLPGSSKRIEKRMEALRVLDNLMPTVIDGFNERQLVFHCYIRKIDIGSKNAAEMRDSLREYTKFTSRMPNNTYLYASALFKQKY
uniref:LETM1 domain-containing protein n=1 Tax=Caenorhabditis japonica TaxID=281687 RepID=A0A8R1E1E0_CAEJA